MHGNRALADEECTRDLPVAVPPSQQGQHLKLPAGEIELGIADCSGNGRLPSCHLLRSRCLSRRFPSRRFPSRRFPSRRCPRRRLSRRQLPGQPATPG
jgi:hypothetical protein